jgi:DNA-binding response OmpR family regulator
MPEGKHFYEFGPFRLDPAERLLLRNNKTIPLAPKAFETSFCSRRTAGTCSAKMN